LHLTPLKAAAGAKLNKARGELNRVQKALEVVPEKAPKGVTPVKDAAPAASLIEEIQNLVAESKQAEIDKEQAEEELTKLSMFKNLDPATAAALQAKGIFVKLYQLHAGKIPFEVDGEGVVEEFGQDENGKYVAVVSRGEAPVAVKGNFTEISMPQKSLAEYREMEAKAKETLARVEKRLGELSGARESIEDKLLEVGDDYRMVEAEASMVGDKNVAAVQGFCPAPRGGANSRRPPANTAGASWWTTPPKTTISRRCLPTASSAARCSSCTISSAFRRGTRKWMCRPCSFASSVSSLR
jgi:hypothetical protein